MMVVYLWSVYLYLCCHYGCCWAPKPRLKSDLSLIMEPAFSWRSEGLSGLRSVTHPRAEEPCHFPSVGHVGCPRGDMSPFVTSFSFPYALRMICFLMHCIKVCHVSYFQQIWHDCCLLCCDEPEHPTSFSFPYALRMMRVCVFWCFVLKYVM